MDDHVSPGTRGSLFLALCRSQSYRDGYYPLHIAARLHRSRAIAVLLLIDPEARLLLTRYGMNPIHILAAFPPPVPSDAMEVFLAAFPEDAQRLSQKGQWLPLHYAACHNYLSAVASLLKRYPQGVYAKNEFGITPIQYAGRGDPLQMLLSRCRTELEMNDEEEVSLMAPSSPPLPRE